MAHEPTDRKEIPLPRGAYTRIARRLRPKVTPQTVRLVALGVRQSKRVRAAVERYAEALQASSAA